MGMGNQVSTNEIFCLTITDVLKDSKAHQNNLLPFIHCITHINNTEITSQPTKEDLSNAKTFTIFNHRTQKTFSFDLKGGPLGLSLKFSTPKILCLAVKEVYNKNLKLSTDDMIIGVSENIFGEEEFYQFLFKNKAKTVTLFIFNLRFNSIRKVSVEIGNDELLGCELGSGLLCKLPTGDINIFYDYEGELPYLDSTKKNENLNFYDNISSRFLNIVGNIKETTKTLVNDIKNKTEEKEKPLEVNTEEKKTKSVENKEDKTNDKIEEKKN